MNTKTMSALLNHHPMRRFIILREMLNKLKIHFHKYRLGNKYPDLTESVVLRISDWR